MNVRLIPKEILMETKTKTKTIKPADKAEKKAVKKTVTKKKTVKAKAKKTSPKKATAKAASAKKPARKAAAPKKRKAAPKKPKAPIDAIAWDIALRLASSRGEDVSVYDVRNKTPLYSYVIVASAASSRRLKSLTAEAEQGLLDNGEAIGHTEGQNDSLWMLVDGGQYIVDVFTREERERVDIDAIYADCPKATVTESDVAAYVATSIAKANPVPNDDEKGFADED